MLNSPDNVRRSWGINMGTHRGSKLDDFLDEEGLLAESEAVAVKRVIAWQLQEMMKQQGLSKTVTKGSDPFILIRKMLR